MHDLVRILTLIERKRCAEAAACQRTIASLGLQQSQMQAAIATIRPMIKQCDGQSLSAGHEAIERCALAVTAIDTRIALMVTDRGAHHAAISRAQVQKERLEHRLRHRDAESVDRSGDSAQPCGHSR